jgi:hypothetical protein
VAPQTPDLAAQVYRLGVFERHGFVLWDNGWYAGHDLPAYSLIWPWVASWLGLRASGFVAVVASAWLFERLARALYGPGTAPAAIWFGIAAAGDVWIGRLTFALGVTFALGAGLAWVAATRGGADKGRGNRVGHALAALLAGVSAATSPVAGALVVLAAVCWVSAAPDFGHARTRARSVAALVVVPLAVVAVLEVLFPEGGFEPYAASSLAAAVAVTVAFTVALPRRARGLRVAGCVYLLVNLLAEIPTPMGSNVQRYGVLLAGPLLLCALYGRRLSADGTVPDGAGIGLRSSALARPAVAAVLAGTAFWVLWGPVGQTREVSGDRSTRASFYAPVERFLAAHARGPVRIEVPFTRAHWEAAYLAPHVALARGWERQLDKRYDGVLESSSLTAAGYRRWLDREGVSYVALPDVSFDQSSAWEVRLIRGGLPYLDEVFDSAHWRIFSVLGATPLAAPLATDHGARAAGVQLASLGVDSFALSVAGRGRFLVKVHYTPYWTVTAGSASVSQGPEGFTEVTATRAGTIAVATRFSLAAIGRALSSAL